MLEKTHKPSIENPHADYSWENDPLWYKDAIIYQLHVKAFFDSNNDGTGDFVGLTQKLDYIRDLGVNTLWLLPFYPSPMKDDGYDISDYRNIYSTYGNQKEFRTFIREAHKRGLKVITELVINHTSDQHPWFRAARRAPPGSAKRNFYVWSGDDKKFSQTRIIFSDTETSNWAWDPAAQSYYWHRFFSHQPDLNHNNPEVVKAVIRVMRFWLDQGVDGLRLDAIPYLCVREGTDNENLSETHAVIRQIRHTVDMHYQNKMLLAEANQWPEDVREYFGEGNECHMAYHFPLMPRMYMSVAQEDRHPIVEIMEQTPEIPDSCQWAIFLRNHDELTLEMVTDRERDYMYEQYAKDLRMRVNVGIRRRLAPLMENDADKMKLMNSLLMSMPGSPIIYYGDEIAMGDNFYLGDRNGVRTPMQWSPDRNGGFSKADPQLLYLPPIMDPIYGYEAVNVEAQSRSPSSLLNWMKRMIGVRKSYKAFGRGSLEFLHPGNRKILAYIRQYGDETILCVANLSRTAQPVELDLALFKNRVPVELLGHTVFPPIGELPYLLTLGGYGVYWFRLAEEAEVPKWHEERLPPINLQALVLVEGWRSFFPEEVQPARLPLAEKLHNQLENNVLPKFLATQRWFASKGRNIRRVELDPRTEWKRAEGEWLLAAARVHIEEQEPEQYFLPLTFVWQDVDHEGASPLLPFTLARIRQRARAGLLCDALADPAFCRALVQSMNTRQSLSFGPGRLVFSATARTELLEEIPDPLTLRRPVSQSSNTAVILNDSLFLKCYRRIRFGLNPELEIGRFLTEVSPFPNIIPIVGALEYQNNGQSATLALLQSYIHNQGDAWNYTVDYLERYLERRAMQPPDEVQAEDHDHDNFLLLMQRLGQRTGELHRALAKTTGDPAFDPEPVTRQDLDQWATNIRHDFDHTVHNLRRYSDRETAGAEPQTPLHALLEQVLALQPYIEVCIDTLRTLPSGLIKTRHHGDYHLGQVLVVENDFVIIDFEGEPGRPMSERHGKHLAVRDVAGLLRSFDYAAQTALRRVTADRPHEYERLKPVADTWKDLTGDAFLKGYERAVENCPVYPTYPETGRALIKLFMLEKALYEILYELHNRPDWLTIPLQGLLELLKNENPESSSQNPE